MIPTPHQSEAPVAMEEVSPTKQTDGELKRNAFRLDKDRKKSLRKSLRNKRLLTPDSFVFTDGRTVEDYTGGVGESSDQMILADTVGTKDLATLAVLTEQGVLDQLKLRYSRDVIYTNIGDILIAINPFKIIPGLYDESVSLRHFHDQVASTVPHVFAISQAAYKSMLLSHKNQCCVISGESGSGKTETAKYLVEHLLSMCKGTGTLEERIMQVNPLLEAFGNARTVINDNSSRFGKYLDIKFGYYGDVLGATLSEYLLEKSRIVRQGDGERNFHVFYYLFAGLSEEKKKALHLGEVTSYHFLRGGVNGLTRDCAIDVNDVALGESYKHLVQCLSDVGFSSTDADSLWELLAAILQLGSIEYEEASHGFAGITNDDPVRLLAVMTGVSFEELTVVLDRSSNMMRGERIEKRFSIPKAYANRDAMAKAMYGRLFGWIVQQANSLLSPTGEAFRQARNREGGVTDIGILDIFGFENFEVNSFEQLCINIANEQLQFYFNQHIFAWELSSYAKEGIDAGFVSYKDNRDLLDMLLQRPLGIFALLDEESRFSTSTPQSLVAKFDTAAKECEWEHFRLIPDATARKHNHTGARKFGARKNTSLRDGNFTQQEPDEPQTGPYFEVSHYAGPVTYDAAEFLPKNRDNLSNDVVNLFKMADKSLLRKLFKQTPNRTGTFARGNGQSSRRKTAKEDTKLSVSAHFKNSLLDLMDKMLQAQPHFVRCLKPNRMKLAGTFVEQDVNLQLRYAGVVETTRIRRDGYAVRLSFEAFVRRFHALGLSLSEMPSLDPEAMAPQPELRIACARIINGASLRGVQLGKTLVFLKYFHNDRLLQLLEDINKHATVLNNVTRVFLAKRTLSRLRNEKIARVQAAKVKAEREARERAMRIRIEKEKAAALLMEQKATEAAERAAQAAKAQQEKIDKENELTMKRARVAKEQKLKIENERKQQEAELQLAIAQAQAAKKAALELEQQAIDEAADRAKEEDDELNAQLEAAAASKQQREEQRRKEKEQLSKMRERAITENPVDMRQFAFVSSSEPNNDEEDFNFSNDLDDESISKEDRQHLANMALKRKNEEVQRKLELKAKYQEEQDKLAKIRMEELESIAEQERIRKEEEEDQNSNMAEESASRMADLDFGFSFSWDTPAITTTAEPAKEEEEESVTLRKKRTPPPIRAKPATLKRPTTLKKPGPPTLKKPTLTATLTRGSKAVSTATPTATSTSTPTATLTRDSTLQKNPTLQQKPETLKKPKKTQSVKPKKSVISALTSITRRSNANITPLAPPTTTDDDTDEMSLDNINLVSPKMDGASTTTGFSIRNKKKKPPPPTINSELSISKKKKKLPPPVLPSSSFKSTPLVNAVTVPDDIAVVDDPPTPPTNEVTTVMAPNTTTAAVPLNPITPDSTVDPPKSVQPPSAPAPNPTPPNPTPTSTPAPAPGEPKRRKLVRGANKKETPVLPEYTATLQAIDELITWLDAYESADSPLARKHSVKTGSLRRKSTKHKPPSSAPGTRRPSANTPTPTNDSSIEALANVLLIGDNSPRKKGSGQAIPTDDATTRFAHGAAEVFSKLKAKSSVSGGTQRKSESAIDLNPPSTRWNTMTVDVKGYSLDANDILAMDEAERLQILANVKAGRLSVDDAMTEIIDHKRRQNCAIM